MLNEIHNAMMLAELRYDRTVISLGRTPPALHRVNRNQRTPIRILHVDDEPDIREVVELSLGQEADLVTRSCGSGEEGLDLVAQWKPDLVLLDLMMPQMGGETTLVRLRTGVKSTMPVIFMTAFLQSQRA